MKNLINPIVFLFPFSILIFIGIISSCEDDKDVDDAKSDSLVFKGITMTDNNGWVIENDPDDWKLAETWTDKENSLFAEKKQNTCNNENSGYIIHPSYMNPCSNRFNIGFTKPTGSRFAFRIVDRKYNVLLSLDSVFTNSLTIDVLPFNISNDTVRIYYKFLGLDCELKGHGDIKIE